MISKRPSGLYIFKLIPWNDSYKLLVELEDVDVCINEIQGFNNDYVELYTKPLDGGSANCNYYTDSTCFGGYRIAGV